MCNKMESKVVVFLCVLFATVEGMEVFLDGEWRQDVGWVVKCSWKLFPNDTLQSVRLYDDERQFMVYRPQINGNRYSENFRRISDDLLVECTESVPRGLIGTCILTIIPFQSSTKDFTYSCEVSGERPKFRIEKKSYNINWIVPPTEAIVKVGSKNIESGRVLLNCTSSALPAPQLNWKIGDQYVPSDFKGSSWNIPSKLWHSWSLLSYTPSNQHTAVCTPEITTGNFSIKGVSAMYNSAAEIKDIKRIVGAILTALLLLR